MTGKAPKTPVDNSAPKRRGPKGKSPEEGRRISHSIRLKPSIADKLRRVAAVNHRSLGEEMEYRITQSFEGLQLHIDENLSRQVFERAQSAYRLMEDEAAALVRAGLARKSQVDDMTMAEMADFIRSDLLPAINNTLEAECTSRIVEVVSADQGEAGRRAAMDVAYRSFGMLLAIRTAVGHLAELVDPTVRQATEEQMNSYAKKMFAEQEAFEPGVDDSES